MIAREAPRLDIRPLGLVTYDAGLAAQAAAATEVRAGAAAGILLALRHPPVITMGRRAVPGELHRTPEALAALGIALATVDRGGGATWHYPEQAVVYPVLDLRRLSLDVPRLLEATGAAVLECLAAAGVRAAWDPDRPGAYVDSAKVASVGYHLSRMVTTHGVAVNLGRNLSGFALMDPCKVPGQPVTCVQDLTGTCPDPDAFALSLAHALAGRLPGRGP